MESLLRIIEDNFKEKNEKNANYSIRAYSKFLEISPATLSRILSRQAKITPKVFEIIAPKLNLSNSQQSAIMEELKEKKRDANIRTVDSNGMTFIDMEKFNIIADWHHYAILHMCSLENFQQDHKWIADRLGITDVSIIDSAIKRLIENKFLGVDENQNYYRIDQFNAILDYESSSKAMRERQKQVLQMSAKKIDSIPISLRDHSSITISVDKELLPEIKDRIKKFRRTLGNYIVKNNLNTTQVYELQLSFFPVLLDDDK